MPESLFDTIMRDSGIPAFQAVFGIPALHTNSDGDEVTVTVLFSQQIVPVGEFGERAELQRTLEIPVASGAQVGQTFAVAGTVTDDDPYPDDVIWTATQLLNDDGYFRTFAVRSGL